MSSSSDADRALADRYGVPVEVLRARWDGMTIAGPRAAWPATERRSHDLRPKVTKASPSESIRSRVINRDGPFCRYCGRKLLVGGVGVWTLTLDHLLPKSRGGRNDVENLVVACQPCNGRKGDRTVEEAGMRLFQPHPEGDAYADCPDCDGDVWDESTGTVCRTCEGSGVLTAEMAVAAVLAERKRMWRRDMELASLRRTVSALRAAIEERDGLGASRPSKALAESNRRQREQIVAMRDRILTMKVELATATGADLERLIPHESSRKRALELAIEAPKGAEAAPITVKAENP